MTQLQMLERMFEAEIGGALFQSKAAMMKRLEVLGLVEREVRNYPSALGNIRYDGWHLTHLGRYSYCKTCKEPESEKK